MIVVTAVFPGWAKMQHQGSPTIDAPGDDADDDADDNINCDNVKITHLSTGTDVTRSKSERDLSRTYSLDLLMVCAYDSGPLFRWPSVPTSC